MGYTSHLGRNELYVSTAAIAAHASFSPEGFRQKDLRFLIELFSNWVEISFPDRVLRVQNTQVLRYLQKLVEEGFARQLSRKGPPRYCLTRTGLLELLDRVVHEEYISQREGFFFLYYFIKNYRPKIEALVEAEGRQFPPALKIELENLLNIEELLERELRAVKRELSKLGTRIASTEQSARFVEESRLRGKSFRETVQELQKLYPYELSSQKPLTELLSQIPEDLREWEVTLGAEFRRKEVFEPMYEGLVTYQKSLERLREGA